MRLVQIVDEFQRVGFFGHFVFFLRQVSSIKRSTKTNEGNLAKLTIMSHR